MTPDPQAILRGLSEAARRWIARTVKDSSGRYIVASSRMDHSIRTNLFRLKILRAGFGGFAALTPLGEEIRALLKESASGQ